jgi:hypothetical protein
MANQVGHDGKGDTNEERNVEEMFSHPADFQ